MTPLIPAIVILGVLALIGKHAGLALAVLIALWPLIKFAARLWLEGFLIGKGARASGVLRDIYPPARRLSLREKWQARGGRLPSTSDLIHRTPVET